jgi:exonuclease SbcC
VDARAALTALHAADEAASGGLPPEGLDAALAALTAKDRRAEELRGRLAKSEPVIEELAAGAIKLQQEAAALDKELARLEAERKAAESQAADKRLQIFRRLGERETPDGDGTSQDGSSVPYPVEERIRETKALLDNLRSKEAELRDQRERVRIERDTLSHRVTASKQACDSAFDSLAAAETRWT